MTTLLTKPARKKSSPKPAKARQNKSAREQEAIYNSFSSKGLSWKRIDWTVLEAFLPEHASAEMRKSALASSFVAALELARQGRLDIRQDGIFAPLYLRAAQATAS